MQNQKINYDSRLRDLVKAQVGKSVLLHCCCAPCASHCFNVLTGESYKIDCFSDNALLGKGGSFSDVAAGGFAANSKGGLVVSAYYYNPAIMPTFEYQKRGDNLKRLCSIFGIEFLEGDYDSSGFLQSVRGLECLPEGGERCKVCFYDRLMATALEAKARNHRYFCTTLTVSPHKNSALINELGHEIARKVGVEYLPSDFKKANGYLNSIRLSEFLGLYRQDYCGCLFSRREDKDFI